MFIKRARTVAMPKYVFVTGGVLSSVGKGVVSASIGRILKARGLRVTAIKVDPYLNVDAGTMSPFAHGEVYVTYDGGETDLDLGHYERFLDVELSRDNNITSGQIYHAVISRERRGEYLGQTVQLIPHVTDEIKDRIRSSSSGSDVSVVEIGGTVGDYEQLPFLEAIRQMRIEEGAENTAYIHVALVPKLWSTGELKTKPLQHSVVELRRIGIQPDIIIARSQEPLPDDIRRKVALFANVPFGAVFTSYDVDTMYRVPKMLEAQGFGEYLTRLLRIEGTRGPRWDEWDAYLSKWDSAGPTVKVAMCGKYVRLRDSYISIVEAVTHAAVHLGVRPTFRWCDSDAVEKEPSRIWDYADVDALIVLPGFGKRGTEGMIEGIRLAREEGIPFLGICFGMQLAVVEFARNVAGLRGANSEELDPETPHPVVHLAPEQKHVDAYGGTMILGNKEVELVPHTVAHRLYGAPITVERHRHRYEVNLDYLPMFVERGLAVSGWRRDSRKVEIIELRGHPYFVASQFHPEFRSRPTRPAPLFLGLLKAAIEHRK